MRDRMAIAQRKAAAQLHPPAAGARKGQPQPR